MNLPNRMIALAMLGVALAAGLYLTDFRRKAAPDVRFATIEGEILTTGELRGKVVLVNFWATDCVPCITEMPRIVKTYNTYRARGFETIAIAMRHDPPDSVREYALRNALPFKVAHDASGNLARSFGDVGALPTTFVIDRSGNIVSRRVGVLDFERLWTLLDEQIGEPG